MKILAVRFQNLNSLKGEHEIRFDQSPLAEAGLFAITGPTGAGKTTILDAITVALYGMVHRHNNDKPLELMTRHTAESSSEVEFEANGKHYRSKWQIRRSRGKPDGKIQAVHMEICDLGDEKPIDLKPSQVPDKVAEICGLDYNQFLRSVMLSQGDFARFLKADKNDRSSLLEKITDTGIYSDISRFAYEKAKLERQKKEELEHRLQVTQLLPDEQRLFYETSIVRHKLNEQVLEQETTQLQEKRQWLQQLQHLRQRMSGYKIDLQTQEEKLAGLQPDFQKLQQHEQANQFVGELTQIRVANGRLSEVQEQLISLEKQLPVLEAELEQAGIIALETGKAYQQQEKNLQALEPILEQVQQLDHQLKTIREHFLSDKETYKQTAALLQQEHTLLQQKELELGNLSQRYNSLKHWLDQNKKLKDMRENLHEFGQAVKDINSTQQAISSIKQERQTLSTQLQREGQQLIAFYAALREQSEKKAVLEVQKQEALSKLKELLATKSLAELEQLAQDQPLLVARFERLLELSKNHATYLKKAEQFAKQLTQLQQTINTQNSELDITQQKYTAASECLADLQKLVTLQQRFQEFEQARHQLQPEHPCPLCGSEYHPFVEGNYTSTLSEDEQRRDIQLNLVKELETAIHTFQLQLNTLRNLHESAVTSEQETKQELKRLQQAYQLQAHDILIPITKTAELELLLRAKHQTSGELTQTLAKARSLSRELESISTATQQLREIELQVQGEISKLQQSEEMLKKQLQRAVLQLQDMQEQQQAFTEIAQSFAAGYELLYDVNEGLELLQQLEKQSLTYQEKYLAYDALREPYLKLQEQVKNLKEKLDEKDLDLKISKTALEQVHTQLTELKEVRTKLFGQKDIQQERQVAQLELRKWAQQAEEARAAQQKKQQELQEQRKRQQEYTTAHTHKKSELDTLRDGLLHVLQQKGIETIEALSYMLLERDEADRLANQKAHVEKQLTELRKSLRDVQHELQQAEEKSLTSETAEVLLLHLAAKTDEHRNLIATRARLEQLLEQDKLQREKNKELATQLQSQQKICNRWSQLSDLIGSAEGHKFSRFAQGLTLAKLVQLANRHLQKLNDRYRILKSEDDELELHIVDTYQADTIRPMNSLSGGESFLVSLALALGLSDLAGRKTQINSLFIDEGFGTLDAETLDAAITTLENLQESGKMIGIISHVEALKERISTQIKIVKQAGGISKIVLSTSGF